MASAGYDPRVAPEIYTNKLCKSDGGLFSTHPFGKKRAKLLERAKVMEEALDVYGEVKTGCGVRGFSQTRLAFSK